MTIKELLHDFLILEGKADLLKKYEHFFDICTDQEYDYTLSRDVLANIDFKHSFAKYIVNRQKEGNWLLLSPNESQDFRLDSFIAYYAMVKILNGSVETEEENGLKYLLGIESYYNGCYLPGLSGNAHHAYLPVRMRPGGGLQLGYRLFVINLMCFRDKKFVMGCRCDSGPITRMKYNKGCSPLGRRTDSQGREWTVFQVDASMSDDFTAIFSNFLDGDGTVEICDWVNDKDVRVVFRANY
ncbi:MAG: hypothetical protein NC453_10710 [Muribaculum sp.]|nr:hypothetical protein [Muribaculum sp.]